MNPVNYSGSGTVVRIGFKFAYPLDSAEAGNKMNPVIGIFK
jgi:hypothetical protein